MFRTFVVPLDGSPLAERVLPFATQLAQGGNGRLVLMRAAADTEEATRYLGEIARHVSGQVADVEIAARSGQPVEQIMESVNAFDADGVVMATHGRTGLAHLVFGSVTEGLLARDDVPVYVVPAQPGKAPIQFSPLTARILVAQDGSAFDETALHTAADLLGEEGELILLRVVTPPEDVIVDETGRHVLAYIDQQEEARKLEAREYLMRQVESLHVNFPRLPLTIEVLMGDAADAIRVAAVEYKADLIVMATHGRTGIRRALVGSVTGKVLSTAATPVVLVHPKQSETLASVTAEPPTTSAVGPVPTF